MDKNEFREKTERMLEAIKQKQYQDALEIADSIDWKKIKNVSALCMAGEVYEYCRQYKKSQEIFLDAYERAPESKKILYRLGALALKLGDTGEAANCYEEFVRLAPKDPNGYILRYKILKQQKAPLSAQIEALEEFKKAEYVEKWAYELALLYDEAGMTAECLEECDDLVLWFSEGRFVYKAMELKMKHKPLTPLQQEKYDARLQVEQNDSVQEKAVQNVENENVSEEAAGEAEEEQVKEADIEVPDEEPVVQKSPTSGLSVQEILNAWEEKQKENAELIRAEQERVQQEQNAESEKVQETEEESPLPDDIRQLMEELETESAQIQAQRVAQSTTQAKKTNTGHLPDLSEVASAVGAAVSSVIHAGEATQETAVSMGEAKTAATAAAGEVAADVVKATAEAVVKPAERGIQLGDTQEMMNAAKALMNEEAMPVAEEKTETKKVPRSKYDTGFVVQGRYDLESQSEIGLKAGLTEEQKKLFSYFVPVHGMSEQLVDVIEKDKKCKARYGTSRTGNLLVVGRKGSGKTVLAVNIVKVIQKSRRIKHGKVAIVATEVLNKKDISQILEKLYGGAIVIEHASRLNRRTITQLSDLMEEQTGEMLVVLEDERKQLDRMLEANPRFQKKFTSRVELPVFINDELVTFGQTYAKENGYRVDEMGILALYSHIDMMQRDEEVVTVADVKGIIDQAIDHSRKLNMKNLAKKVFGKARDEADRIILTEQDFKF